MSSLTFAMLKLRSNSLGAAADMDWASNSALSCASAQDKAETPEGPGG